MQEVNDSLNSTFVLLNVANLGTHFHVEVFTIFLLRMRDNIRSKGATRERGPRLNSCGFRGYRNQYAISIFTQLLFDALPTLLQKLNALGLYVKGTSHILVVANISHGTSHLQPKKKK
jgi:hypothetical protein